MSLYRYSPPNAARDLCLHDGVGAPSQWVQRARLEVIGRALQGGTVQPGRRWDKQRGVTHPIRAVPFCATPQARNISPRPQKVHDGSGLRSCDCAASSPLFKEADASSAGAAGRVGRGEGQAKLLEIDLNWENHDSTVPPSAARDLFVSGGGGVTSQWVQIARLEILGRAVEGGAVQPERRLDIGAERRRSQGI